MGLFSAAKLFGMTIRESATDGSDFTNPDADYRRLFLGEDGNLHLKDSAGTVTDIGGGGAVATDAIWDAAGDLAVGSGANTAARLAKGSDGEVLKVVSGTVEWDPPLGAWTDYTPTWTATSVNPTLGDGTIHGRYKLLDAKTLAFQVEVIFGSTTSAGTGGYSVSLPAGVTSASYPQWVAGYCLNSGTTNYVAIGYLNASDTKVTQFLYSGGNTITNTSPFTFNTGDAFGCSGTIEIA